MKLILMILFCLLTSATCKRKVENVVENTDYLKSKYPVYIDIKRNHYITFSEIPDSLLSPEGKMHSKTLKMVMENDVAIENNKLVIKLTKKQYLAKGRTEQEYNELKLRIIEHNHFYDSVRNDMVEEMIDDMKRGYKPHNPHQ